MLCANRVVAVEMVVRLAYSGISDDSLGWDNLDSVHLELPHATPCQRQHIPLRERLKLTVMTTLSHR